MYNATEQFVELNKASVAQASKIAAVTLGNAEKLMNLNLSAAKTVLAQSIENAQAAASVKDVQELFTLRSRLAETGVQSALASLLRQDLVQKDGDRYGVTDSLYREWVARRTV